MPRVIGTPPVYKFDQKVSKNVDCVICLTTFDWKRNLCYGTKSCIHKVCYTCLYTYLYQVVKNAIQYKSLDLIPCPGGDCQESFEAHQLLNEVFVSKKEIDKWWDLAISSRAYIKNKVIRPIKGCGAIFDVDEELKKKCVFTECVVCYKGICATCPSP